MKRIVLMIIVIMFGSTIATAQFIVNDGSLEKNVISVSATAITKVPADCASFTVKLQGHGKTLDEAVQAVRLKASRITEALIGIGLKEKDLATSKFYSSENSENKAFLSSKRDYVADIDLSIKIMDFALFDKSIITVANNNPAQMSDVNFQLIKIEKANEETLKKALQKAKSKAELMATELGVPLGKPIFIEEQSGSSSFGRGMTNSISFSEVPIPEEDSTSFFVDAITITKTVKVVFKIVTE